jgi:hypothetical protein
MKSLLFVTVALTLPSEASHPDIISEYWQTPHMQQINVRERRK